MGKVNVVVVDTTGSKEQDATLPDDVPIAKVVDKLVEVLYLPAVNTAGVPITYKFLHKATGRHLLDNMTLAQCDVHDGDVLRLIPEITAGGGSPVLCAKRLVRAQGASFTLLVNDPG